MFNLRFIAILLISSLIFGCSLFSLTPKDQTNLFSSPNTSSLDTSNVENAVGSVKKDINRMGESFQAVQNGLVGINGKLTGIEATASEMNAIKAQIVTELSAVKGDLSAVKGDVSLIKGGLDVKGDLSAFKSEIVSSINSELSATLNTKLAVWSKDQQINTSGGNVTQTNASPILIWGIVFSVLIMFAIIVYLIYNIFNMKGDLKLYKAEITKIKAATYPVLLVKSNEEKNTKGVN